MTAFFTKEDGKEFDKIVEEACNRAWNRMSDTDKKRFDKGTFDLAYAKAINDNFEKIFFN